FTFLTFSFETKQIIFLGSCLWFFLEIIMSKLLTGFPWLIVGLSQYSNNYIAKLSRFIGIFGISFIVIATNLFFYTVVKKNFSKQQIWFIFFVFFLIILDKFPPIKETKDYIKVMLVQPNFNIEKMSLDENKKEMTSLLKEKLKKEKVDIIILPEGTYQGNIFEDIDLIEELKKISLNKKIGIILGTFTGQGEEIYNSSLFINQGKIKIYRKIQLVPYGEFILGERFKFIRNTFLRIAGYKPNLKKGEKFEVFQYKNIKFSTPICYENIFPEIISNFVKNGSDLFIVITNDSWFGNSLGPYQHFYHNIFRAIESGRYFIQVALTGITGIIDPEGKPIKILEKEDRCLFFEDVLIYSFQVYTYQTFFSKFGVYPFFLFCLIVIGIVICRN
ncbi:MAG: apolipoprotein N-acyltransferase, partial [bacterium]|nr:apolipoprotein N-acyltransferase [bacterium]MDW8163224.1 apolipoprotein N-acyltransferase [Candidatus Omnitrophota bacterium]